MIKYVERPIETSIKPEVAGLLEKFVRFMIEGVYWKRLISIFSREQADMIKYVKGPMETSMKPEVAGRSKKFVRFMNEGVYWKRLMMKSDYNYVNIYNYVEHHHF